MVLSHLNQKERKSHAISNRLNHVSEPNLIFDAIIILTILPIAEIDRYGHLCNMETSLI